MSKLREKFVEQTRQFSEERGWQDDLESATQCEQISDDFAVKFAEWLNIQYRELNHTLAFKEKTLTELLQIFKNNHYETN